MAASLGSECLTEAAAAATAGDPALASAQGALPQPGEARGTAGNLSPSSPREIQPPPKKIRVEERAAKPKKLTTGEGRDSRDGKDKLKHSHLWMISSPGKASSEHSVSGAAAAQSQAQQQQAPNAHGKVLKQSHFFLHKTPLLTSKASKKSVPKDKCKLKNGEEERRKKHKLLQSGNNISINSDNSDITRCNNVAAAKKRENGEVALSSKGRPSQHAESVPKSTPEIMNEVVGRVN